MSKKNLTASQKFLKKFIQTKTEGSSWRSINHFYIRTLLNDKRKPGERYLKRQTFWYMLNEADEIPYDICVRLNREYPNDLPLEKLTTPTSQVKSKKSKNK